MASPFMAAQTTDLLYSQTTPGDVSASLSDAHLYGTLLVIATAGANYRILGPGLRTASTNNSFIYPVVETGVFDPSGSIAWKVFRVMTHNADQTAAEPIRIDGFLPNNEFGHHGLRVYGLPRGT